jgi:hypothetical protein
MQVSRLSIVKKMPFGGCGQSGSVVTLRLAAIKGLQDF